MIPRFLFPFLPYRSYFSPFLVMCAIAVPCWLAFRLYRYRISGHGSSFHREVLLLTFVVYLSGLAVATLLPTHNSRRAAEGAIRIDLHPSLASLTCSSTNFPENSPERSFCVRNARGNAILFFPLGILIPLVWKRLRFWRVIQIAVTVSISIEIFQYFSGTWGNRSADVNDVILNVAGACLGLMLLSMLHSLASFIARSNRIKSSFGD